MEMLPVPKRTQKRSRVFLAADVDFGGCRLRSRIRDISRTGALLEAETPPAVGTAVEVSCGDSKVAARVVWSDGPRFGVEFDAPLPPGFLDDQLLPNLKVSAPRTYRSNDPNGPEDRD